MADSDTILIHFYTAGRSLWQQIVLLFSKNTATCTWRNYPGSR